jgi:hypothetical protein
MQAPFPRPSSTEPIPSQALHNLPSGLPSGAVGPPVVLSLISNAEQDEAEEGKGERASRITHHLRMSSRHRSVSPTSHRFPVPIQPQPSGNGAVPIPGVLPVTTASLDPSSATRPAHLSLDNLSASPGSAQSEIVSPRPMLSPKHSFSVDPMAHATVKSERVEALEKMADEMAKQTGDLSADLPKGIELDPDIDKTLPRPPVPSGKERVLSVMAESRPRADTLFPPTPVARATSTSAPQLSSETPRTPTITAFSPRKFNRVNSSDGPGESGLDALERRLLAEVGTRKVDSDERKPDARSVVMPIEIPRPTNGPQTPLNDSAISSLTLSNRSMDARTHPAGKTVYAGDFVEGRTERGRAAFKDENVAEGNDAIDVRRSGTVKKERKSGKKKGDRKDEEAFKLRDAAKGRVAAWLESVAPDSPPAQDSVSPSPERSAAGGRASNPGVTPLISRSHSAVGPLNEPPPVDETSEYRKADSKEVPKAPAEEHCTTTAPNPRSSGFVPLTNRLRDPPASPPTAEDPGSRTPRVASRWPGFLPPLDQPAKYDVRSARGGRGGKVTAVTAIWAAAAAGTAEPAKSSSKAAPPTAKTPTPSTKPVPSMPKLAPPPVLPKSPGSRSFSSVVKPNDPNAPPARSTPTANGKPKPPPKPVDLPRPKLSLPTKAPPSAGASSPASSDTNVGDLTMGRARLIKSTSVPAVISSSHATPTISSTASLVGKSPHSGPAKKKPAMTLPPIIDEVIPENKPTVKSSSGDLAFGKAKLRDLIKKYQGTAS